MITTDSTLTAINLKLRKIYKVIMVVDNATNDAYSNRLVIYTDDDKVYARDIKEFFTKFRLPENTKKFLEKYLGEEGWFPIDTAPKDGTQIIVWDEDQGIMLVSWRIDNSLHKKPYYAWCVQGSEDGEQGGHYTADKATYWRTLPAPPKTTKGIWENIL